MFQFKNKYLDQIQRWVDPRYVTIQINFPEGGLAAVKKAAKLRGLNIHQFIELALREQIKSQKEQ